MTLDELISRKEWEEEAEVVEYLKELKWYRNQDLVRREDVLNATLEIGKDYYLSTGMKNSPVTNTLDYLVEDIKQIPKAEYRGENDD